MSGRRAIALVAWREIRERLRSRAFLASTVLILALVAGSAVLGTLVDPQKTYRVAVTTPVPTGLAKALQRAAEPFDEAQVRLRTVGSAAAGRQLLEDARGRRAAAPVRRPARLPEERGREGGRSGRLGGPRRSATSCRRHRS